MFTNSGMFTARLAAVAFSIRIGGLSLPSCVDVREIHLRVGRPRLRRKHQPAAVGRKAVPRIHAGRVAPHAPRLAARRRNNVQLAVGTHELPVAALDEHDPSPIGRHLGKRIAHAVARRAGDRLRHASLGRCGTESGRGRTGFAARSGRWRISPAARPADWGRWLRRAQIPGTGRRGSTRRPSAQTAGRRRRAAAAALPSGGCTSSEFRASDRTPGGTGSP